jgi:hypothetical protein
MVRNFYHKTKTTFKKKYRRRIKSSHSVSPCLWLSTPSSPRVCHINPPDCLRWLSPPWSSCYPLGTSTHSVILRESVSVTTSDVAGVRSFCDSRYILDYPSPTHSLFGGHQLVAGLVVTQEVRVVVRRERNQRTWVHVNVKNVGVGRVGVCILCVSDSEERERGVGAGVNALDGNPVNRATGHLSPVPC